jgi:hypothetical protein
MSRTEPYCKAVEYTLLDGFQIQLYGEEADAWVNEVLENGLPQILYMPQDGETGIRRVIPGSSILCWREWWASRDELEEMDE